MKTEPVFPKVVRIEPAGSCNLRCQHCPTGLISMGRGIMSGDVFRKTIEDLQRLKASVETVVLYHGGEPLINKSFFEFLKEVKEQLCVKVKTVTNGMLLNEGMINKIIESELDEIEISLDGEALGVNDLIRRNSSGRKVLAGIKALQEKQRLSGRRNLKISVSHVYFLKKTSGGQATPPSAQSMPSWISRELGAAAGEVAFKSTPAMTWPDFKVNGELFDLISIQRQKEFLKRCDNMENTITIRWNGDVVACCFDLTSKLVMGNIMKNRLDEIWASSIYGKLREQIAGGCPEGICKSCNQIAPRQWFLALKNHSI
jgi:radical SAM protein with 4Fe4S-binding SPASM domain